MTTAERVLVEILERKKWIVEQTKQQTLLLDHHLASLCLLHRIPPPPSLFPSHLNELKDEELISGILLRNQQPSFPCSSSNYSLYWRSIAAAGSDNVKLPNDSYTQGYALNESVNTGNRLSVLSEFLDNAPSTLHRVPESDFSIRSPQECRNVENCSQDHAQSLVKIQRSKSRQRALELRNSAKAAKSCWHDGNRIGGITSRIRDSEVASLCYDHVDEAELVKAINADDESCFEEAAKMGECGIQEKCTDSHYGRTARSGNYTQQTSSVNEPKEAENVDSFSCIAKDDCLRESLIKSIEQANHDMELSDLVSSPVVANARCAGEETNTGDCRDKEMGGNVCSSGTERSKTFGCLPSSAKEPLIEAKFCYNASNDSRIAESIDRLAQQINHHDASLESIKPSSVIHTESYGGNKDKHRGKWSKETGRNIYHERITGSRFASQNPNFANECSGLGRSCSDASKGGVEKPSSVIDSGTCGSKKEKHVDAWKKEKKSDIYHGRITRSRSSSQNPNFVNEYSGLDSSHGNANKDGFDKPNQRSNHVNESRELIAYSDIINESNMLEAKALEYQSNEEGCDACSRISQSYRLQTDCVNECLDPSISHGNIHGDDVEKLKQQYNHAPGSIILMETLDMTDKSHGMEAKVWDYQLDEDGSDTYCGRSNRSIFSGQQFDNVNGFPRAESSFNIAKDEDGVLAQSFGKLSQVPQSLHSVQGDRLGLQDVSETQEHVLPFTERSKVVDLEMCDAVVAETDGACSVASGSNQDDVSLRAEVLVSKPSMECAMFVRGKQLEFDDVEESSLHRTSNNGLENNQEGISPRRQPFSSQYTKDVLHVVESVNFREKPISSIEMLLPREQDFCIKEDKMQNPSEVYLENFAVLVEERNVHLAKQRMDSSISQDQIASSCLIRSWPQNKQTKVQDAVLSDNRKSPVEEMQQNLKEQIMKGSDFSSPKLQEDEDKLKMERVSRSTNVACSLIHERLKESSVSSSTELVGGVSQSCLSEIAEAADATRIALATGGQKNTEESQAVLQFEDRFELGSTEHLTNTKKNIQERKSDMEGKGELSSPSVVSPNESVVLTCSDQNMPEFEGFVMETDDEQPCIAADSINFDKLDLPDTAIERASVLEQLCKSVLHTPLSQFSTTYELYNISDLYQSIPVGLLDGMEMTSTLNVNANMGKLHEVNYNCLNEEDNCAVNGRSSSDYLPSSSTQSAWDIKKPYVSPVRELWSGIISKSGSSEKRMSSVPDLPSISEETENTDQIANTFQAGIVSEPMIESVKREPFACIKRNPNLPTSVWEDEILEDRPSVASVALKNNKRKFTRKTKENKTTTPGENGVKRANGSLHSRFSKPKLSRNCSLRKGEPGFLEKEVKCNNIVSNISSFIPLVQQKQADAAITGKRDIKVKALEAAEAAKRLAEKKENERKMRKEALKLERTRMGKENLKQLELEKEKKEQERKKKEADMAAKKRQREDEERKEKERKRKRVEELRRKQLQHEEKLHAEKENKALKSRATEERAYESNADKLRKHEKIEKSKEEINLSEVLNTEPKQVSTNNSREASNVHKDSEATSHCGENPEETSPVCRSNNDGNLIFNTIEEQSYEISPYKSSDDEDDDEQDDDIPNSKFIPSWASSKSHLALVVSSQKKIDPGSIFPSESFCNINEVLLPRKLQQK